MWILVDHMIVSLSVTPGNPQKHVSTNRMKYCAGCQVTVCQSLSESKISGSCASRRAQNI